MAPSEQGATSVHSPGGLRRCDRDAGFTIIEVMIAMLVLLVGVLGTLTMLEGSASSTSRTSAREQGTNLARDLVERARQAPYASMTMANAAQAVHDLLPSSDAATSVVAGTAPSTYKFTVTRRNVVYAVTMFTCSVDDPTDGVGVGNATFCAGSSGTLAPGGTPPGPAPAVNVLGIVASGTLLQAVCNAIGPGNPVLSLISSIAPISICPAGSASSSIQYDSTPDDMRRVRFDISWTRRGAGSISQTTLLTNPLQT